jgi:hypothetical protein
VTPEWLVRVFNTSMITESADAVAGCLITALSRVELGGLFTFLFCFCF